MSEFFIRPSEPRRSGNAAIFLLADDALDWILIRLLFIKMWYGCLPSAAVILVAMSIPNIACYFDNKYILGNPYRRYLSNQYEWHTYLRDKRLGNGDPYKQLGLDCLCPDKDEEPCKCP